MAQRALLIAGPTASGKTAMAIERSAEEKSLIINTDSMQVYDVLNVISARPNAQEMAQAAHRMYGYVPPVTRFSTGAWLRDVQALIQGEGANYEKLIFVGGTGLYFDALINGFAQIPDVPQEVIQQVEEMIQPLDADQRAKLLAQKDPAMAKRLQAPDPQRVARAISVMEATNKSLAHWQDEPNEPSILEGFELEKIVLNPERDILRNRIAKRFGLMMQAGAIEEVEAITALGLDPTLPAMRAIGVPEISAYLRGDMTLDEAREKSIIATQQYAKRQRTWFRNRMTDWQWVDPLA
ncbi:tRNA (adenosine(37)-N6)-dimethylallyltransferase MiaA [Maritalea porphyrae]|uniref:tRNA (adenosine(37)-N6)-dimethylallyltransferase MiaA n=1 Tax=Maritalea porphyrae TaxID=880732 RepID=UPI0022B07BB4|nr:tRNA (adenosine(37)-N6)-dimethylallyltransferase MiaA [Maritalea porphyrae]MCZ4272615.1 tRNA (adenosine(37)-N6)-dimethylallyltransferase MiaA [Maritalea porphyrae]